MASGSEGGSAQRARWFAAFYHELIRLARICLAWQANRGAVMEMEATDLVHEAWLRLAGSRRRWQNREHFLAAATQAMRCVLIDHARREATVRHGAGWIRVDLPESGLAVGTGDEPSPALREALDQFIVEHAAESELVKLRYFDGLTLKEAAMALGVTHSAAKRSWTYTRAWLCRKMQKDETHTRLRA
jgi:RNA polymerase sigma factor (TIGR02999 family)